MAHFTSGAVSRLGIALVVCLLVLSSAVLCDDVIREGRWIEGYGGTGGFTDTLYSSAVYDLLVYDSSLYVCGMFNICSNDSCGGLAVNNGDGFQPVTGHYFLDNCGFFTSLTPYQGGLVATCYDRVAYWDGSDWAAIANVYGCCTYESVEFGDFLFLSGDYQGSGAQCDYLFEYRHGNMDCVWQIRDFVYFMTAWRGDLYFLYEDKLTRMDSVSWDLSLVGDSAVYARPVGVYDDRLIVQLSGDRGVVAWDGAEFNPLGLGFTGYLNSLVDDDTLLIGVGGDRLPDGNEPCIWFFDGASWSRTADGVPASNSIASWNGRVYIGGQFDTVAGIPSKNIAIWEPKGCCKGPTVGDLDQSGDGVQSGVSLADLTLLIDMLFVSFDDRACIEEADINGSGQPAPGPGDVTLSDLTMLVDHLFVSFDPLPACP